MNALSRLRPGVLLPVLLLAWPVATAAQVPADAEARVDRIFARWNTERTPGCAVAAGVDGRTVLARAYGMAELEHGVPNRPGTVFEAGSVAKQFTAAAVVLLALDGRLSLQDDVRRYIPELPDYGTPITIRRLIDHTSGLRDWGSVAEIAGWGRGERTHSHEHVLDILARQRALNYAPGEAYSYTNSGYNLLAILVERVSGIPFAEFSRQRIFEPLGLADTRWRDDYRRLVPNRATAYAGRGDTFVIDRPIEHVHGNGGLLTTVADLLRWDRALAAGELGGPEFVRLMHEQGVLTDGSVIDYAAGVQIGTRRGVREVSHTGATSGYRAFLGRYPDQGLSVALLCNAGTVNPGAVGGEVVDVFLSGLAPASAPATAPAAARRDRTRAAAVRVPAAELRARAGLFRDERTGEPMRLAMENGALRMEGGAPLVPLSRTRFRIGESVRSLEFELAAAGTRPRVRLLDEGPDGRPRTEATFAPVDAFDPDAAALGAYAGTFHSDDAETTLTLRVEDGALVAARRPGTRFVLTPLYPDTFRSGLGLIRFHRDPSGRINALGLRQSRVHDLRFVRIGD
jgi:CubicO group peptidase (beta-lactamase class C family)